jgi:DNA-binding transcriptional MerR regulator
VAVLTAKKMGFTLREVKAMLEDPEADLQMKLDAAAIDAQIQILERQLQETNEALAQLRAMRRGTEHGG